MKVWLVHLDSYGEVEVYSAETDIAQVPSVKSELDYLDGEYEGERSEFIANVKSAVLRGSGEASIEERLRAELVEVK